LIYDVYRANIVKPKRDGMFVIYNKIKILKNYDRFLRNHCEA